MARYWLLTCHVFKLTIHVVGEQHIATPNKLPIDVNQRYRRPITWEINQKPFKRTHSSWFPLSAPNLSEHHKFDNQHLLNQFSKHILSTYQQSSRRQPQPWRIYIEVTYCLPSCTPRISFHGSALLFPSQCLSGVKQKSWKHVSGWPFLPRFVHQASRTVASCQMMTRDMSSLCVPLLSKSASWHQLLINIQTSHWSLKLFSRCA